MTTMRAVQVATPGGPFELVERETAGARRGEVRVRVQACGVCHSDMFAKDGRLPGTPLRSRACPGHEVAGVVDALGEGADGWGSPGDRVGVGWFGGHCHHCEPCRRGDFINCENGQIPGITYDGGYADAMVAPAEALARIPDDLAAEDAAPLLCAGITTFNALRQLGAHAGDVVAILGVGGLGHLGVQFAAQDGLPHGRHRPRHREGGARPRARRPRLHRLARRRTSARSCTKLGGAARRPRHRHQRRGDGGDGRRASSRAASW